MPLAVTVPCRTAHPEARCSQGARVRDPRDGTPPPLPCLPSPASATGRLTVCRCAFACTGPTAPSAPSSMSPPQAANCLPCPKTRPPPRLLSAACPESVGRACPAACPRLRPACAWCSHPSTQHRRQCRALRAQASGEAEPGSSPASPAARYKNHLAPGKLLPHPSKGKNPLYPEGSWIVQPTLCEGRGVGSSRKVSQGLPLSP